MKIDDVAGCEGLLYDFNRGGESSGVLVFSEGDNGMIECGVSEIKQDDFSPVVSLSISSRQFFSLYKELSIFVKSHTESLSKLASSAMQPGDGDD